MKKDYYKTDDEGNDKFLTCWDIYSPLARKLKFDEKDIVLDACCGQGKLAKYIQVKNLYGFDLSKKAVKIAKKSKKYVEVRAQDIYKLKYKNKYFDKTVCVGAFQYLINPEKAFKELERVTKETLIITVSNSNLLKLKSYFSKEAKKEYLKQREYEQYANKKFLISLAKKKNIKMKIFYISNKFEFIRNLFGNYLASEVVAVYYLK